MPIRTIDGVEGPRGVAINHRGEVVVTEGDKDVHSVTVFSPGGERLRSFNTFRSDPSPVGNLVAVDGQGNVLVADLVDHCIRKFTAQGEPLEEVSIKKYGTNHYYPKGIAFDGSMVYVATVTCVQILNSDLSYCGTLGGRGSGEGQFFCPQGMAFDGSGNIYVADGGNHRIQVFTAERKFLRMFGRYGNGEGELNVPYAIAIDSSDRVYISELSNHRVSIFTSEGKFATSFGSWGSGPGQFRYPSGLAVDNSGVVYVCDRDNDRVQLF